MQKLAKDSISQMISDMNNLNSMIDAAEKKNREPIRHADMSSSLMVIKRGILLIEKQLIDMCRPK